MHTDVHFMINVYLGTRKIIILNTTYVLYLIPTVWYGTRIYHILVDDKANILPCNKTLSFV
jgi:hypothetical protein